MDKELDVLVIGDGFAGIYQLDRLRSLGFRVKAVEAAPELGDLILEPLPGRPCRQRRHSGQKLPGFDPQG